MRCLKIVEKKQVSCLNIRKNPISSDMVITIKFSTLQSVGNKIEISKKR
jgi:hypothetical protein